MPEFVRRILEALRNPEKRRPRIRFGRGEK